VRRTAGNQWATKPPTSFWQRVLLEMPSGVWDILPRLEMVPVNDGERGDEKMIETITRNFDIQILLIFKLP
jgi:hypothetical protein